MPTSPLPNSHFQVDWGGTRIGFSEVSGLGLEVEVIEYREGTDEEYALRKLAGRVSYTDVVLKRGIVRGDGEFFAWIREASQHRVGRRDVTISLLDEEHEPVMSWKLARAFPRRLEGPGLDASGNTVAIETLVLAHEGLVVETG